MAVLFFFFVYLFLKADFTPVPAVFFMLTLCVLQASKRQWLLFLLSGVAFYLLLFCFFPSFGGVPYTSLFDLNLLYYLVLTTVGWFLVKWGILLIVMEKLKKFKLSSIQKQTLQAGDVWIEKQFFSGKPCFKTLFNQKMPQLTIQEKDFLEKETKTLCSLSSEWELINKKQISKETKQFLESHAFFGLTVPKSYNGKNFSPYAHAKVIEKLATHNIPLSIIVMTPNSLGPAKLLLKYGTDAQKDKYLYDLAMGRQWPCFGLTEDMAGSDASAITSNGVLFKENGVFKIRLNWDKRWITLSAKATLLGLAVQLKDPEKLYSSKENLGITCVLVPAETQGISKHLYHDPMGIPIYNAPIQGRDVVVLAEESIIGGLKNAGKGWEMITETLSLGRGISLPSLSVGFAKKVAWLSGTYAFVRRQFALPIGRFEGVQENLAHIAGLTYIMQATQTLTLSGLNQGINSSVSTALTKYNLTEMAQKITKKGMDILGGVGLSLGPKNKIAYLHISLPMAITVEGANILTRTFIIYTKGLIKTHSFIYPFLMGLEKKSSLKKLSPLAFGFIYRFFCNFLRSVVLTLSGAWLCIYPNFFSKEHRCLQKLELSSALFAFLSDLNLVLLGNGLKQKGSLSGYFADLLSYQYMAFSLLWCWKKHHTGRSWLATRWGIDYCFFKINQSLIAILSNYPQALVRFVFKPLLWWFRLVPISNAPSDSLNKKLALQLMKDQQFKNVLCNNMYFPENSSDQLQKLKTAYTLSLREEEILKKIMVKKGKTSAKKALEERIISFSEYNKLQQAKNARKQAIQVDAFTKDEYFRFS